ncbi:ATP-binding cassette domain-containing protein [Roseobacter sp. HKCCD7870]|uniref:ATP-binding cassette domain-containing protein n=1 Tax=Roseobacter sp. HKCCD7870 TaxID=3120343 RepID=UPI0030EEF8CC
MGYLESRSGDIRFAVRGIEKKFGSTKANQDISFSVAQGEIMGLLGANGAGKSTLIKIVCGVVTPDSGEATLDRAAIDLANYNPQVARKLGIRLVHQELSLCTNLSVSENFFLEMPDFGKNPLATKQTFSPIAKAAIENIFPDTEISPSTIVGDLSLAQQQMVEIARAAIDPELRLLILDEPTSSLDGPRAEQLHQYLKKISDTGVSVVFISHKIRDVLSLVDTVTVMESGKIVWSGATGDTNEEKIFSQMGGRSHDLRKTLDGDRRGSHGQVLFEFDTRDPVNATGNTIQLRAGEVVGLAGLEGQGQREALRNLLFDSKTSAFVSGDRRRDGIFPINSVIQNATVSAIAEMGLEVCYPEKKVGSKVLKWSDRVGLSKERLNDNILDLSGGNQQKALMVRALCTNQPVLLLDDPTRGVDSSVKREIYNVLQDIAESGRLVVWNSSEDDEFEQCDKVLVFSGGVIIKELDNTNFSKEAIIHASFSGVDSHLKTKKGKHQNIQFLDFVAPAIMLALFILAAWFNPMVVKYIGLDLILAGAVPLVFATLAQTFIIGGSQIDLGIGPFMALISVVSATFLVDAPFLGVLILCALLLTYASTSLLVVIGKVPSIIATLGLSFIWIGIGYIIQPIPGGSAPSWITSLIYFQFPIVPIPVVLILSVTAIAVLVNRSTLGTILRGFGNNPSSLKDGGWGPVKFQFFRWLSAGIFAVVGGILITGIYTASDINAGGSLTLLSVTAFVMGGGMLSGGIIRPVGAVCAAISLTLINLVLGQLNLDTDFTPMVQGSLLLTILLVRTIATRRA